MSLSTREGLSPFEVLAYDTQLDEEMPCEHPYHDEEYWWHGGPGVWYVQFKCSHCPESSGVELICDEFYKNLGRRSVTCGACGEDTQAFEAFIIAERK